MTPEEREKALGEESPRVEWKQSLNDPTALLRAVCALANDLEGSGRPGYVTLGLSDRGEIVGLGSAKSKDETVRSVSNRLNSTKLLPHPSYTLDTEERGDRLLIFIRIEPYPVPPIVRVDGSAWVRIGTETRRATEADLLRLQERRPQNRQPFDIRPLSPAAIEDLNVSYLHEKYRVEKGIDDDPTSFPDFEPWLAQHDLAQRAKNRWIPNSAAILLHGLSPQSFLPGAVVELVRYDGDDFVAPVRVRKTATGTLSDQLDIVWGQMTVLVAEVPAPQQGIRTPYRPEYPIEALKELARNMVQHRLYEGTHAPARISWFDSFLLFQNPGAPFGQAAEGAFGDFSDYRNPTLTRGLVELGYVERLGRGIRRVRGLLEHNGNPPLEVATDGYTTLTVRKGP